LQLSASLRPGEHVFSSTIYYYGFSSTNEHAIIGFFAASRLKAGLLVFNAACLGVLFILLLGFAIFCLAGRNSEKSVCLHTKFT
jgi:hypothetical protein